MLPYEIHIMTSNLGLLAESVFSSQCIARGLAVAIPMASESPYDRLVDTGDRIIKVQIKGTDSLQTNSRKYRIKLTPSSGAAYRAEDVDVFAGWIKSLNIWLLVPFAEAPNTLHIPEDPFLFNRGDWVSNWKIFAETPRQAQRGELGSAE